MSYIFTKLKIGDGIEVGWFVLVCYLGRKRDSGWEEIYGCIFSLSVIRKSEEDVVVQEPPGVGGGISSAI